jgi:hypothetical protein
MATTPPVYQTEQKKIYPSNIAAPTTAGLIGSATTSTTTPRPSDNPKSPGANWEAVQSQQQQASPTAPPPQSVIPGTVSNDDQSTFNVIGAPQKQAVTSYAPTIRTVNAPNETVAGQFNALTQSSNPLIAMARTGAMQQANARGLLNSNMAIGAADAAAYQAALPIAQADASTYSQAARENQAYGNEALKFGATATNDAAKNDLAVWSDVARANLDSGMKIQLATIEADYKTVMQTSATASEIYKQAMKNIADIAANKDMNAEAKAVATQNQFYALKSGLELSGAMANLDLSSLLNFSGAPFGELGGTTGTTTGGTPTSGTQAVINSSIANWKPGDPVPAGYKLVKNGTPGFNLPDTIERI